MGIIMRTIEVPDLHNYKPEFNEDGTEKHIVCDGARYHVCSYDNFGPQCSEKNCEVNAQRTKRIEKFEKIPVLNWPTRRLWADV